MIGLTVNHGLLVWGNASLREHGSQFVVHFEAQLALTIYCIQLVKMYGFFEKEQETWTVLRSMPARDTLDVIWMLSPISLNASFFNFW